MSTQPYFSVIDKPSVFQADAVATALGSTGHTFHFLDEPDTGLLEGVRKLLEVHRLVEQGNSVMVIEHNLDVIKTADHVLDFGPGSDVRGSTFSPFSGGSGSRRKKYRTDMVEICYAILCMREAMN